MEGIVRIALGIEAADAADEIVHFLDRSGRTRVVATAGDDVQLAEAVRQLEPNAIIASPSLLRGVESSQAQSVLAVDTSESVAALRTAIDAGAEGFFVWPDDREKLASAAAKALPPAAHETERRAEVLAVYGPRGGAGATFVATHLAAALAQLGKNCLLLEMDPEFADINAALGVTGDEGARSIEDLRPVVGELGAEHVDEILWSHPAGFRVAFSSGESASEPLDTSAYAALLDLAAASADVVLLHLPRALDARTKLAADFADRVLLVLSLDVLSFHSAKRALDVLRLDGRCEFIVNRADRSTIVPADVDRVFGRPALSVIPWDRSVREAQDRGTLIPRRSRATRAITNLAKSLAEGARD
ncbi:MAG: hypothetical protein WD276_06905 [Actinomycetota bacterium]